MRSSALCSGIPGCLIWSSNSITPAFSCQKTVFLFERATVLCRGEGFFAGWWWEVGGSALTHPGAHATGGRSVLGPAAHSVSTIFKGSLFYPFHRSDSSTRRNRMHRTLLKPAPPSRPHASIHLHILCKENCQSNAFYRKLDLKCTKRPSFRSTDRTGRTIQVGGNER